MSKKIAYFYNILKSFCSKYLVNGKAFCACFALLIFCWINIANAEEEIESEPEEVVHVADYEVEVCAAVEAEV